MHGLVSSSFKKSESNLILQILGASIAEAQVSINAVISFFSLLFLQKPRWEYSSWHSLCICKQTVASSFQLSLVCSLINNRHALPRVKKPHFMGKPSLFSPLILAVQPLYYVFRTPSATSVRSTWRLTKSIKFMFIILFNEFLTVSGKEEIFSFILALPTTKRKENKPIMTFWYSLCHDVVVMVNLPGNIIHKRYEWQLTYVWHICTYTGFNNMFKLNFFFNCAQVGFTESYIRRICITLKMTRTELTWYELITCLEILEFDNQVATIVEEWAGVLVT